MRTLQHLDHAGLTQSSTAYDNAAACEKDLLSFTYGCDRLMRLSAYAVPSGFTFESDPRQDKPVAPQSHEEWQRKLFAAVSERKLSGDVFPVDLGKILADSCAQAIPGQFTPELKDKQFLQMELLMLRELDKASVPLTGYGASLKNAFLAAGGDLRNPNSITAEGVDLIAKHEGRVAREVERQREHLATDIRAMQANISPVENKVAEIQKSYDWNKDTPRYLSDSQPFHPSKIEHKIAHRAYREKRLSFLDKVKLLVVRKLGRDEEIVFKDGVNALKKQLADFNEKAEKTVQEKEREHLARLEPLKRQIAEVEAEIAKKQADLASIKQPLTLVHGKRTLDDEHARDLGRVMRDNNAFILHSIATTNAFQGGQVCGENSPLQRGTTLAEKIQILRVFDPSVSCSTFAPGAGGAINEFSAAMGVVINSGRVELAGRSDQGTRVDRDGNRFQASRSVSLSAVDLAQQIEERRNMAPHAIGYDELAVSNAKVAGVYLNVDRLIREDKPLAGEDSLSLGRAIFQSTRELEGPGLPMYIILRGHMHQVTLTEQFKEEAANYDFEDRKRKGKLLSSNIDEALQKIFHIGDRVTPADLARGNSQQLSAEEKVKVGPALVEKFNPEFRDGMIAKLRGYAEVAAKVKTEQRQEQGLAGKVNSSNKTAERFLTMMSGPAGARDPSQSRSKDASLSA